MDYTKKIAMVLLFLMVVITPRGTVAQKMPKDDPVCSSLMEDLLGNCFRSVWTPTEACCNDLKSATTKQVSCICDMFVPNQGSSNITRSPADELPAVCGVADKFSCGISQGRTNKVAASVVVFGLVASLFFVMF